MRAPPPEASPLLRPSPAQRAAPARPSARSATGRPTSHRPVPRRADRLQQRRHSPSQPNGSRRPHLGPPGRAAHLDDTVIRVFLCDDLITTVPPLHRQRAGCPQTRGVQQTEDRLGTSSITRRRTVNHQPRPDNSGSDPAPRGCGLCVASVAREWHGVEHSEGPAPEEPLLNWPFLLCPRQDSNLRHPL
jgi:hypothetical protein